MPLNGVEALGAPVRSLALAKDGKKLAAETEQGIYLWNLQAAGAKSGSKLGTQVLNLDEKSTLPRTLAISDDSRSFAVAAEKKIALYNAADGKKLHEGPVDMIPATLKVTTPPSGSPADVSVEYFNADGSHGAISWKDGSTVIMKFTTPTVKLASAAVVKEAFTATLAPKNPYQKIEVFYGTNRQVKTNLADDQQRLFGQYFTSLDGWLVGLKLLLAWILPAGIVKYIVFCRRRSDPQPFCLRAIPWIVGTLILVVLILTRTYWLSWEGGIIALIGFLSASLFGLWRPQNIGSAKLLVLPTCWLLCWLGIAYIGSRLESQRDHQSAGKFFGNLQAKQIAYGICEVTVPPAASAVGALPRPDIAFGIEFPEDPRKHVMIKSLQQLDAAEFVEKLQKAVNNDPNKEAFIFLHGFNNTFQDAAFRTALLWRDLGFKGPPIFYSWPSQGQLQKYGQDEEMVEYSQDLFTEFLRNVAERSGSRRLFVVAHSMGNRALVHALKKLNNDNWLEKNGPQEVVFAAPDVFRDSFIDNYLPYFINKGPRLTLYANEKDFPLGESNGFVHGGNPRAGQAGQYLVLLEGLDTVDASALHTEFLSHDYAFTHARVIEDLRLAWLEKKAPAERRLKNEKKDTFTYWELWE